MAAYAHLNNQEKSPRRYLKLFSWCSIKDDYRTLVGLEGVNVVENYTDIDEEEDDE